MLSSCTPLSKQAQAFSMPASPSTKEWELISSRRIYFGHQSVGFNIMEGISWWAKESNKSINIIEARNIPETTKAFWLHNKIGENTKPESKIANFVTLLNNEHFAKNLDIAFFKFCYIDFNQNTDVPSLFEKYREAMDLLKKKYPELLIVHFTAPLTVVSNSFKAKIKHLLGKTAWGEAENAKRAQFNALIRKTYPKNLVFDLAELESTAPDGSRFEYSFNGKSYPALLPLFTEDGGHLNSIGQKIVANKLISFLAALSSTSPINAN